MQYNSCGSYLASQNEKVDLRLYKINKMLSVDKGEKKKKKYIGNEHIR